MHAILDSDFREMREVVALVVEARVDRPNGVELPVSAVADV